MISLSYYKTRERGNTFLRSAGAPEVLYISYQAKPTLLGSSHSKLHFYASPEFCPIYQDKQLEPPCSVTGSSECWREGTSCMEMVLPLYSAYKFPEAYGSIWLMTAGNKEFRTRRRHMTWPSLKPATLKPATLHSSCSRL